MRRLQDLSLPAPSWDDQSASEARTSLSSGGDAALQTLEYFKANLNLYLTVFFYAEQAYV